MAMEAFDLAERLQTLVFVMSDLDLGMNTWMSKPFTYPGQAARSRQGARRGDAAASSAQWGRYKDVDGDGIPYRTVPGDGRAGVFHARLGPQRDAASTASGRTTTSTTSIGWRASSRPRKTLVPRRSCESTPTPRSGSSRYGSSHWAIEESRDQLREEVGHHDVLSAPARLSVHAGRRRLRRAPRAHLRRRAEPRRADAAAC